MRVAILGAGGVALGYAGMLDQRGFDPVIWTPTGRSICDLAGPELRCVGAFEHSYAPVFATSLTKAVEGAAVVILAMRGNGHKSALDLLSGQLRYGQQVVISAELSLGGLYLAQRLAAQAAHIPISSLGTTVLMGRRVSPGEVRIGGLRDRLDVVHLGPDPTRSQARLTQLFGDRFAPRQGALAVALSNLNPPVHMANALCNFTRIEKAEIWSNYGSITPGVARLIEGLDAERLSLARTVGLSVRSIHDHYHFSFGFAPGIPLAEMSAQMHERRGGAPAGPQDPDTRFITEDLPFGIHCLERIAAQFGQSLPLHSAGIEMFNAIRGRDFRAANDLIGAIDLSDSRLLA